MAKNPSSFSQHFRTLISLTALCTNMLLGNLHGRIEGDFFVFWFCHFVVDVLYVLCSCLYCIPFSYVWDSALICIIGVLGQTPLTRPPNVIGHFVFFLLGDILFECNYVCFMTNIVLGRDPRVWEFCKLFLIVDMLSASNVDISELPNHVNA